MEPTSERFVLQGSRRKSFLYLLLELFVFILFLSLSISESSAGKNATIGWIATVFFGLAAIIFLGNLLKPSKLILTGEGFRGESFSFRKASLIPWKTVHHFFVDRVSGREYVLYDFSPDYEKEKIARYLSFTLTGKDANIVFNNYNLKNEELCQLLNQWLQKYGKKETLPTNPASTSQVQPTI